MILTPAEFNTCCKQMSAAEVAKETAVQTYIHNHFNYLFYQAQLYWHKLSKEQQENNNAQLVTVIHGKQYNITNIIQSVNFNDHVQHLKRINIKIANTYNPSLLVEYIKPSTKHSFEQRIQKIIPCIDVKLITNK